MTQDTPEYGNENERDESFVRTGFLLIEEGLDADGQHSFRYRHTLSRPMAIGLMQIIADRLRQSEQHEWRADLEELYDGELDPAPPDEDDPDDYGSLA